MYSTAAQRQNARAATSLERCYGGVGVAAHVPPHKAQQLQMVQDQMQLRKPISYANISIKKVAPNKTARGKVVFIHGQPCSGKTFAMDYLESCGWVPVDGDDPAYSKNTEEARNFMKCIQSLIDEARDKPVDPAVRKLHENHLKNLCKTANKHADAGKNVAISFYTPRVWNRDLIRECVPDVVFIRLDVALDALVERNFARMERATHQMGMTMEEAWAYDDPEQNEMRKIYGEKYNVTEYKRMWREQYFAPYDEYAPHEASYGHAFDNTTYSIEGIKKIREILGITSPLVYKPQHLQDIQTNRYANVNMEAWG